jgi:hypothetical protein
MEPRIVDEVDYIVAAFREKRIDIGVATQGQGLAYMYAERQLLVQERYFEGVLASLRRQDVPFGPGDPMKGDGDGDDGDGDERPADGEPRPGDSPQGAESSQAEPAQGAEPPTGDLPPRGEPSSDPNQYRHVLPGLILLHISGKSVPAVLDVIDRDLGEGCATPNHVLTVADETSPCAATDPEEVVKGTEPYPGICHCNSGAGVRVYIADTGLIPDEESHRIAGTEVFVDSGSQHPWLARVQGEQDPQSPTSQSKVLKPYAGHGTFVAGVMRCIAPDADIFVGNVFSTGGSALEADFVQDLQQALHRGTDIFHLSCASTTRKDLQLLSFWFWLKQLRTYKGIVCVAPAGNSGNPRAHWPAASPEVASVGALAADWRSRASFSNYGGWVDAYAPGRNLINAYAYGRFDCEMWPYNDPDPFPYHDQHRHFHGMARWSGTSFSSPIVTGLIADRMWRTGENGIEAAAAVLRQARSHAIPGVGAIALPCGEDRGCRCAEDRDCRCGKDRDCRCGGTPVRPRL